MAEKLTLVFAGDFPDGLQRFADKMGLSGVIKKLGHLPHDEVLRLAKSADLLLVIATEGIPTAIPGKIYEYWAVSGPPLLLLSSRGAATDLVERHNLGIAVEPYDVTAIEQAVMTVYRRREMGEPIRINTAGINEYDRKTLAKKLAETLSGLHSEH
jgi:glycosyltransferase involved in cell wall biosynthesis